MKTNNRDRTLHSTQKRQFLSFAAVLVGVFFLMPGVQLSPNMEGYVVEPVACVGGNFKVVEGTVGGSSCVKRLTASEREGGEASEAIMMNGYRHERKEKGRKGKGKGGGESCETC